MCTVLLQKNVNTIALSKHINNIIVDNYSSRGSSCFVRTYRQTDIQRERERERETNMTQLQLVDFLNVVKAPKN